MNTNNYTKRLALCGILTALVAFATLIIRVPIPLTSGYFNLGDSIVFISSIILGPIYGGLVGGLGSFLADILAGYPTYAPFTFIIKGLEGLVCGYLALAFLKNKSYSHIIYLAFLISGLIMPVGYFLVESLILYDYTVALSSVVSNLLQMVCSVSIGSFIIYVLAKSNILSKVRLK